MTRAESILASRFLEMAADKFSNHGCNDVPEEVFEDITDEERLQIEDRFNYWNSGGNPDERIPFKHIGDDSFMGYLAELLKPEVA